VADTLFDALADAADATYFDDLDRAPGPPPATGNDAEPPAEPTWPSVPVSGLSPYGATLTCTQPAGESVAVEWVWYVNGVQQPPNTATTSKAFALVPGLRWNVQVAARNAAGVESSISDTYSFETPPVGVPTSPPVWARR
jgi:hypothetical protein